MDSNDPTEEVDMATKEVTVSCSLRQKYYLYISYKIYDFTYFTAASR